VSLVVSSPSTIKVYCPLAVLIDADNAQPVRIEAVLRAVAGLGTVTVTRAYGDWSAGRLKAWTPHLGVHAMDPVQAFAPARAKNATDAVLNDRRDGPSAQRRPGQLLPGQLRC
jgi:hypothetical protein